LQNRQLNEFVYSNVDSAVSLWAGEKSKSIAIRSDTLNKLPWRLTTDFEFLQLLQKVDTFSVPLSKYTDIFNGIQTSAERPPIYWFSSDSILKENRDSVIITKNGKEYSIEKALLRPFFKPTKKSEKGLNTYSIVTTDKQIIFPYDDNGRLIPIDVMKNRYGGIYAYLEDYFAELVPRSVSSLGTRDVPNATADTWYQYGRTQALTAFNNTPKLIVGVLSKEPMYAYDSNDLLIASGGTAGYCAVVQKADSPYAIEYIQAWLTNSYTERIIEIVGSDFEGGFVSRGTFVLQTLPFIELDFEKVEQKELYVKVVDATRKIYRLNEKLSALPSKSVEKILVRQKTSLISEIEQLIGRVYRLDFC
jgi:hypothetical protein